MGGAVLRQDREITRGLAHPHALSQGSCPPAPPGKVPRPPDDAAVMEALSDPQLHRQVRHRPARVAADEVGQLLQDLGLQDVGGALVEGRQQGRKLLEVHQGIGLCLQLEESEEPGPRRKTQKGSLGSLQTGHCLPGAAH